MVFFTTFLLYFCWHSQHQCNLGPIL